MPLLFANPPKTSFLASRPKKVFELLHVNVKLEDLKVLKRSPDLFNNVKIGQGQLRLIIQTYFVIPYMGNGHFDQVTQK